MIYLTNIDLNKNELQNAVLQPLATAPTSPKLGQVYYNSTDYTLYQYNGTAWKRVGVVYSETSDAGKVITGLSEDGTVTTTQVKNLLLSDYTPVSDGYVSSGDSLETAIKALDQAVKNAVAGGGEVNQYAFSNVKVGTITISATGKTDTVEFIAGDNVVLTPNSTNKTVTIAVNIADATASKSGLMSSTMYTKLSGIASGAEVNVQSDWNVNDSASDAFIKNKPTALSAFTNDKGFIDSTVGNLTNYYLKTETYTKDEVNNIVNAIHQMDVQKVDSLPTSNISTTTIYLVPKTGTTTNDIYDEYIYVNSAWEMIGNTVIDLTNYLQKDGDGSNVKATFTQASSRTLPSSGETLAVILGKVKKYLADLKTVAFTGAYSDLTGKLEIEKATQTLATGATTATVTVSGTVINAYVTIASTNEKVMCDMDIAASSVTVTLSSAYTADLTITVWYKK